ncbi:hypothetical protein C0J52_07334, partial [Blattella germanica]
TLKETALHSEKIGVWVAISKSRIIGPLFYDTTVDSDVYIDQIIYPFLSLLNEDEIQCCFFSKKIFQNMCTRVELCLEQRGKHFQHLL